MTIVFLERVADNNGNLLPGRRALRFLTGITLTDNATESLTGPDGAVTGAIDVSFGNASTPQTASSLTLGAQAPAQYTEQPYPTVATAAGETVNLLGGSTTVAIGASSIVELIWGLLARGTATNPTFAPGYAPNAAYVVSRQGSAAPVSVGTSPRPLALSGASLSSARPFSSAFQPTMVVSGAANNGAGLIRLTVDNTANVSTGGTYLVAGVTGTTEANETWVLTVIDATHVDLQGSAFTNAYVSGGTVAPTCCAIGSILGNAVQIQAVGLLPAKWYQSQSVIVGDVRYTSLGSTNTYVCTTLGTTSGAGTGPAGTGTAIVDGTAKWDYVQAGRGYPINWTVCKLEILQG